MTAVIVFALVILIALFVGWKFGGKPKYDPWLSGLEDEEDDLEWSYCQDCGCMIEFGIKSGDDVIRPAYVTESGNVFCNRCGPAYDDEERYEREFYDQYYEDEFAVPIDDLYFDDGSEPDDDLMP